MAYQKQTWVNLPDQTTPISADRLNHMENGIYNNSTGVENCALITEAGNKISINLNSENYKMTISLYDKDNNLISTSNEVDLPIESLIVSITYDSVTKELVITLKDGTETRIPIGDLISGLEVTTNKVTELSSSSTDTQYPSAKCVYDIIGDVESLLETLDVGSGV